MRCMNLSLSRRIRDESPPGRRIGGRPGRVLGVLAMVLAMTTGAVTLFHWISTGEATAYAFRKFDGVRSAPLAGGSLIATTEAQWRIMWRGLRGDQPVPPFNEARQTGVAIILGERPATGHSVSIISTGERAGRIVVLFEERHPPRPQPTRAATTTPYTILLIDRAGADVVVEQRVRD
ncbi:MAG: protease complex subunit PrcB family protein [Alphaproteobacteria bacterium]|nr:protease complex subunit PrcB family protein [Alphaproteobacteria bacterium]